MFTLLFAAFANPDSQAVRDARAAAEASIREGEAHQLTSRYWQTYQTAHFTAVVPSYADAVVTANRWTLDLAGDYTLAVHRPTSDASQAVRERLQQWPGAKVLAEDTPTGRVFHVDGPTVDAFIGVHAKPLRVVELTAPSGSLDATVARRVWDGFRVD
jgi:hypothetical protein